VAAAFRHSDSMPGLVNQLERVPNHEHRANGQRMKQWTARTARSLRDHSKQQKQAILHATDRSSETMVGLFEGVVGDRLTGWVFDPLAPRSRFAVTLVTDQGRRQETLSDFYRADLHQAGYGDGHVAFSLPASWCFGARSVRAVVEQHTYELKGSPATLAIAADKVIDRVIGTLRLRIDPAPAAGLSVSGWIYDQTDPLRRCCVALRCRGRNHVRNRATLFRPDLSRPGIDALHGFRLEFSNTDAGPKDRIDLVDGETGAVLATLRA
jgi:hypothetical protein